jgi:hypothetical protein
MCITLHFIPENLNFCVPKCVLFILLTCCKKLIISLHDVTQFYMLNYRSNSGLHATARNNTVQSAEWAGRPRNYWWNPGSGKNFFFISKMSSQVLCTAPSLLQSVTVTFPWDKAEGVYEASHHVLLQQKLRILTASYAFIMFKTRFTQRRQNSLTFQSRANHILHCS